MTRKPIIIVGAGPSGLIAAKVAKKNYDGEVILIDREDYTGGILNQCIHSGFGVIQFKKELTGPEYADLVFKMALKQEVQILLSTTVIDISKDKIVTVMSPEKGLYKIEAAAIVLCTGCRERARGVIHIPGERPSGVYCAGLAQKFVNIDGYLPGKKVVILGSGDIGLIMARRLTLEGAKVLAVVEVNSFVGGLSRNVVQCLNDFDIPLYLSHTVTDIIGKKRVEKVTVSRVSEDLRPIAGSEFQIECDTILLSIGLIPENELAELAGVELDPATNGAIVDQNLMTNVPGIFCCGNALHVHDLVDKLAVESENAGKNAASFATLGIEGSFETNDVVVIHDENIRYILPHKIDGKKDVKFHFRVRKPMRNIVVNIGEYRKNYQFLAPNEMASTKVKKDYLDDKREIRIWIEEKS